MARGVAAGWVRQEKTAVTAKKRQGMEGRDDVTVVVCLGHVDFHTRYVVRGEQDPGCSACKRSGEGGAR